MRRFYKHPVSQIVEEGSKVTLSANALSATGAKFTWELYGKKVGEGRSITFEVTKANVGKYRCLLGDVPSRSAVISIKGTPLQKEEALVATAENDVFIEILENTGKDATQETINKVMPAISKKIPEALKYNPTEEV